MPHIPLYATPQFEGESEIELYGDTIEELGRPGNSRDSPQAQARSEHFGHLYLRQRSLEIAPIPG